METYRAAVIGCGRMGGFIDNEVVGSSEVTIPFSFATAFETCERTELASASELRTEVMQRFGERYSLTGDRLYADYRDLIDKEQPDILGVATQPEHRAEIIIYAAEHGVKAVYAEKTMAASMSEADAVVEAVERNGVAFNMGTGFRWHPGFDKMKELIESGELGPLLYIVLSYANGINQHGIHALDLALYINGDQPVDWVQGSVADGALVMDGDVLLKDPDTYGMVHFKNGINAHILVTPLGDAQEAVCERGQIVVFNSRQNWELRRLVPRGRRGRGVLVQEKFPEFLPYSTTLWIVEDLVHSLDTGEPTRGGVHVAHSGDELTFAFVESHLRGGARVELPLVDSKLKLDRNPEPRQPMFEPLATP